MTNKVYYTDRNVRAWVHEIIRGMSADNWRPDYIVGLTRGGLVPANMISQYLDVPMHALKVSLRDDSQQESNLWMAGDAFGYRSQFDGEAEVATSKTEDRKNILIVDDINDSGATLNWIKNDWQSSFMPNDERWNDVWNKNVRFAVLINNENSDFRNLDYAGKYINKYENPEWCVFPWENWWE